MDNLQLFSILILCSLPTKSLAILRQIRTDPLSRLWDLTNFAVQSRQHNQNYYYPNTQQNTQTILEALSLISKNDDHHCVPKLLCELVSGGEPPYTSGRQFSFIPTFQFDMDSISGLLSAFGASTSPILVLGKAALLGYTSKENSDSCTYAYPRCPKDPDVLLNYLNNHNGGFFRYFNGIRSNYFDEPKPYLKFPYRGEIYLQNSGNRISFPNAGDNFGQNKSPFLFRDFKGNDNNGGILPVIYSDRTGTGELILDSSEFFD